MTRSRLARSVVLFVVVVAALGLLVFVFFDHIGRALVPILTPEWQPELTGSADAPRFSDADASLERGSVQLQKLSEGWTQVTDVVFPPGRSDTAVVLQRTGDALHWTPETDARGPLLHVDVASVTEQGLLGVAFHPRYAENGRVFLNTVEAGDDGDESRVTEWRFDPPLPLGEARATRGEVLLQVPQPFQNHNAGQLVFGPDGMLYVGYGDGGLADDPHRNGQNPETFLGSILRVDVDRRDPGLGYAVPQDNPFVGRGGFAPETWAYGLRNPWRYSFDRRGRLWVADVGQDAVEEVNIVQRGDNLGWDLREGFDCTSRDSDCETEGLREPIWVYRHALGASITGGYVYEGAAVPALRGHYVCADFLSGRLFAVPDPSRGEPVKALSLGQWPLLPSTFGRDAEGELYVADFAGGILYGLREGDPALASAVEVSDEASPSTPETSEATPGPMPRGDAAAGEAVYQGSCIACHQADGAGMGGVLAADFTKDASRLAKSDEELYKSVTEGVPGTTMVAWTALSDQQRADAVAYIRATFGD